MPDVSIDEAVTRTCEAIVAGNLVQVMTDLTPEAVSKLMAAQTQMGGGPIPQVTGYELQSITRDGSDYIAQVTFQSTQNVTLEARWREVNGAWKIVDFNPAST